MTASLTTPTLCVLVIITGPSKKPDSSTHVVPVISPLPLRDHQPANTGLLIESFPRGRIAVTPMPIGPLPIWSFPSPGMRVVWPTVNAGDVGDGIEWAGCAVERNAKIAGARLCNGFF